MVVVPSSTVCVPGVIEPLAPAVAVMVHLFSANDTFSVWFWSTAAKVYVPSSLSVAG